MYFHELGVKRNHFSLNEGNLIYLKVDCIKSTTTFESTVSRNFSRFPSLWHFFVSKSPTLPGVKNHQKYTELCRKMPALHNLTICAAALAIFIKRKAFEYRPWLRSTLNRTRRQEYQLFTGVISAADSQPNCSLKIDARILNCILRFRSMRRWCALKWFAFIIHSTNQSD